MHRNLGQFVMTGAALAGAWFATIDRCGTRCSAQEAPAAMPAPVAVDQATLYRPTAMPDRIILGLTDDPAHNQAVAWRTDASVVTPQAQIALADHGPDFAAKARSLPAASEELTTDLGSCLQHTIRFSGLEPATLYAYRVGDGANWSEWVQFRTASVAAEPFSFIYVGDAQNDIKSLWSRVIRNAYSDAPRARFIVHAGDLINRGDRDAEWAEWFGAGGWVNTMVPSAPVPGNHEYSGSSASSKGLTPNWRPQFPLPVNGPEGLEETAYHVDYQGLRLIGLNSNTMIEEQAAWLETILRDNPCRWTVATFHHPVYSSAKGRDNPELRRLWQPIFDRHGVDLVLQGHDHTYGRSGLRTANVPTGTQALSPVGGTVYVVSVSGPKMYDLSTNRDWIERAAEDTQLYQIISIDGGRLRYEARTATGALYDAFDLVERPGQPNQLIERNEQAIPERLTPATAGAEARQ